MEFICKIITGSILRDDITLHNLNKPVKIQTNFDFTTYFVCNSAIFVFKVYMLFDQTFGDIF